MKLAGLSNNIQEPSILETEFLSEIRNKLNLPSTLDMKVFQFRCQMPDFEFGSSRLLSFAKKASAKKSDDVQKKSDANAAQVWSLADIDDDDVDLVNSDDLLDEDDLQKPDPSSLRGILTTGLINRK